MYVLCWEEVETSSLRSSLMHAQGSRYLENNIGEELQNKGLEKVEVSPRTNSRIRNIKNRSYVVQIKEQVRN